MDKFLHTLAPSQVNASDYRVPHGKSYLSNRYDEKANWIQNTESFAGIYDSENVQANIEFKMLDGRVFMNRS